MSASRFRAHTPLRPRWQCRSCDAPYPCGPARLALLVEYADRRIDLAILLASMLQLAMDDLYRLGTRPDPAALHARFLSWVAARR